MTTITWNDLDADAVGHVFVDGVAMKARKDNDRFLLPKECSVRIGSKIVDQKGVSWTVVGLVEQLAFKKALVR